MSGRQCLGFWCLFLITLLLFRRAWTTCHREEQFVKAEGTLQSINPVKTTTVTAIAFCSTECVDFPGCNSFAYLTATNTENCKLSANVDGESSSAEGVVYKRVSSKAAGCAGTPCLNGGTCQDVCDEPYYSCQCPFHTQGKDCEWDVACIIEDWTAAFDFAGTHKCAGTTSFMSGIQRSDCHELFCLDAVKCSPIPIEYSKDVISCQTGDWWRTFGTNSWNYCPDGHFVKGFMRGEGHNLGSLEEGVCCKPSSAPDTWGDCYILDVVSSFDNHYAWATCEKPQYYIAGLETHECDRIDCIEKIKCCRIAL